MSKIAMIGAYERENFGDLLFLIATRWYLGARDSVCTAPFVAATDDLVGSKIIPFKSAISTDSIRSVWVVGGEVGGVPLDYAFRMSASDAEYRLFRDLDRNERQEYLARLTGMRAGAGAYMPILSGAEATLGAGLVFNSVGLRGVGRLLGSPRRCALTSLREAGYISVRDSSSSATLNRFGIPHRLAPDLIHTAAKWMTVEPEDGSYVLVQIRSDDLRSIGVERFSKILVQAKALKGLQIRLFSAGSARGHDSSVLYQQLVERIASLDAGRDVAVSTALNPMEKVQEIAESALFVGTSLHGMIVSAAFNKARVGLSNIKVTRYADTWNEPMPYNVSAGEIDEAAQVALSAVKGRAHYHHSERLSELADASVRGALEFVDRWASEPEVRLRDIRAERVRNAKLSRSRKLSDMAGDRVEDILRSVLK